jgi:hypothetical protein
MHRRRVPWLLPALLIAGNSHADSNHLPQPWRAEAVVEGRDETYNEERFLHRYSFRHSQSRPAVTGLGFRGTGGSVGSSRLYFDTRLRQDFSFNGDRQAFMLDMQRSLDFDGAYDRQLMGFRHQLTNRLQVWLQGDVFADKSEIDIYASARYATGNGGWLHGSWIRPDYWFNDKTDTDDRLKTRPHSYFLQWHQPWQDQHQSTTASLTVTPEAAIDSARESLTVESQSIRGALTQQLTRGDWRYLLEYTGEYSTRDYRLDDATDTTDFRRQYHQWSAEVSHQGHQYRPTVGVRYVYLNEQGYFGRALDTRGDVRRREPMVFASIGLSLSPRSTLRPAIYLGAPEVSQSFSNDEVSDLDSNSFRGKLALPLAITLSRQEPVILTIAPTFRLHEAAFGGGSLQLHWPL